MVTLNVSAPLALSSRVASVHCNDLRLLHISSGAAREAYPGWGVYGATKAALDHHARAVKADGDMRIRVCSLAPGVIDTEMQAEIRGTDIAVFPLQKRFIGLKQDKLLSSPADTAKKLVSYLLSDDFGKEPIFDLRQIT